MRTKKKKRVLCLIKSSTHPPNFECAERILIHRRRGGSLQPTISPNLVSPSGVSPDVPPLAGALVGQNLRVSRAAGAGEPGPSISRVIGVAGLRPEEDAGRRDRTKREVADLEDARLGRRDSDEARRAESLRSSSIKET